VLLHIRNVVSACSKVPPLIGMKYFCLSNRHFDSTDVFVISINEIYLIILMCIMFCSVLFNDTVYC